MGMREGIQTDKAPAPVSVYSQAIKCNGMVYCSGALGVDPSTNNLVEGGIADRTDRAFRNLGAVLEAAGSSLQNVVKVTVYLTSMDNYAAVNQVYARFFKDPMPARTCVAVKELPLRTDVEIDCIAHQ